MYLIDLNYLFKRVTLHCIKAKIKKYPNNVVNSNTDEEKIKNLKIPFTGKYPESLFDYCNRVLAGREITLSFDRPNRLKILHDPNILSLEKINARIKKNGLVIEIIEQKSVEGKFGFFKF